MNADAKHAGPTAGPIVVADIGSTNARFGIVEGVGVDQIVVYATAEAGRGVDLVERYLSDVGITELGGLCIGLAGPVQAGVGTLTNSPIGFAEAELEACLGAPAVLLNDFAAVAAAAPFLAPESLVPIARAGSVNSGPLDTGTRAVIGPGTGLGMAALVAYDGRWLVLPSEGGHCDLPGTDALEAEVVSLLLVDRNQVPWEACLSGPGLTALYRAVCGVWGCAPEHERPEAVTAAAAGGDPVCHQTVEMFWGMLGNAAGNLALMMCAVGGVFIAGGIVPAIIDQLDHNHFRRRFEQRGALSGFAQRVPTAVIVEPAVGLLGAARAFEGAVEFLG